MSKPNGGSNSSGTGSLPNVITVNRILNVQLNVNSSTIIVQLGYCVCTVTQQALTLSLGVMLPSAFLKLFLFPTLPHRRLELPEIRTATMQL